jgi:hypothetical protein
MRSYGGGYQSGGGYSGGGGYQGGGGTSPEQSYSYPVSRHRPSPKVLL